MKNTKILIEELVSDKKAQKRDLPVLTKSLSSFFFVILSYYLISALYNPMVFSLPKRLEIIETISFGFVIVSLLSLGFKALIPGMSLRKNLFALCALIAFFMGMNFYRTGLSPVYSQIRSFCEVEAVCASLITSLLAHLYLNRFPFSKYQPFSLAIVWGFSLSVSFLLHSACSNETAHMLLCHVLPTTVVPFFYGMKKLRG